MKILTYTVCLAVVVAALLQGSRAYADTYYVHQDGDFTDGFTKVEGDPSKIQVDHWEAWCRSAGNGKWHCAFCGNDPACGCKTAAEAVALAEKWRQEQENDRAWCARHNNPSWCKSLDKEFMAPIAVVKNSGPNPPIGPAMKGSLYNLYKQWDGWLTTWLSQLAAYETGVKWLAPEGRSVLGNARAGV